jgi:hypothetical protein
MDDEYGHGHSVAAWTGVGILLLAALFISLGIFFGWMWATWVGIAGVLLGVGAWVALNRAGYGQNLQIHED